MEMEQTMEQMVERPLSKMAAKMKTNQGRLEAMTQANQEMMEANYEKTDTSLKEIKAQVGYLASRMDAYQATMHSLHVEMVVTRRLPRKDGGQEGDLLETN
jgi:hypothetical protein